LLWMADWESVGGECAQMLFRVFGVPRLVTPSQGRDRGNMMICRL